MVSAGSRLETAETVVGREAYNGDDGAMGAVLMLGR